MTKEPSDVGYVAVWVLTIAWVILAVALAFVLFDRSMPLNAWGDYLAGVSAPLAFLWLVRGYYQQGEELQQNTLALRAQQRELQISAEAQSQLVEATRRQLELAIETAEVQSRLIKYNHQPRFRAATKVYTDHGIPYVTFTFKNVGARATSLQVVCENTPDIGLTLVQTHEIFDVDDRAADTFRLIRDRQERRVIHISYVDSLGESEEVEFVLLTDTSTSDPQGPSSRLALQRESFVRTKSSRFD